MQRVLIIGSAGAGKSTLSRALGEATGLPVIHLDAQFWRAGWTETPKDVWAERVGEMVRRERWIMDGNYGGTMEPRIRAADTVVLLALSRWLCLYRVFARSIRGYGRARPDLHPECPEQLPDFEFLRWIWTYPREKLPRILTRLREEEGPKTVVVLRTRREVREFLARVESAQCVSAYAK